MRWLRRRDHSNAHADDGVAACSCQVRTLLPRCICTHERVGLASTAGLDSRYTIMRNERMLIIMLGNVCVVTTQGAFASVSAFTWRDAAICAAIPWVGFLLKTWYFELCQIDTARDGSVDPSHGQHATQRNAMRATLWSVAHMPLIGCILWISIAINKMFAYAVCPPRPHWHPHASPSLSDGGHGSHSASTTLPLHHAAHSSH
jgi:hypothetical protein